MFRYEGGYYACDNRCPHMGYPLSEGSVRDGVLICHWHHWEFDLKTGGCFLTFGDDVASFPVEDRGGVLYVGIPKGAREAARQRLVDRGKRALEQGLKDRSSFLIAKAVTALREAGATPREIIQHGLFYGAHKTSDGWSSGVAILTLCANLWDDVDPKDHNLFLVHGLAQIANRTAGSSRRQRFPFPRSGADPDLTTLKRWFRRYVDLRDRGAAERILLTLHDRGQSPELLADFVYTAATDFYFTGDGHALDFANKMFEGLDYVEWQGAHEILRPIVVDLVSRTRHEETSRWQDAVPVLEEIFGRIDEIWEANQAAGAEGSRRERLRRGHAGRRLRADRRAAGGGTAGRRVAPRPVPRHDLCRRRAHRALPPEERGRLARRGQPLLLRPRPLPRLPPGAVGAPAARPLPRRRLHHLPALAQHAVGAGAAGRGQRLKGEESFSSPRQMLDRLQEFADFQKVAEAGILVNQYLEEGHDVTALKHALAHILLREDAELHMFQVLEVAFRHYDLSGDPEEKRIHLLAATRYITAQKVMKNILWSTENAERLQRGELLSDREDD